MPKFNKKVALYYRGINWGEKIDDDKIVQCFWERDESAISAVSEKYGRYCNAIARNIVGNEQLAEECVNDTLLELWEAIPPNRPKHLMAFISKVVRNNAFNMVKGILAKKRGGGESQLVLDELNEVASEYSVELTAERREILAAINDFLKRIPAKQRKVFVLRYWHCCDISDISQIVGISEANVYSTLKRVRKKLIENLKNRGGLI